jgi:pimeloyl-ACP methyl ester carboxylesterase
MPRDKALLARPGTHAAAVLSVLASALFGCSDRATPAVVEGHVTTNDSVRLYYRIVGDGSETVVVPMALYLETLLTPLARPGRRLVFYDPRHRGRSARGELARVSLDRQIEDLEQLRAALGIERMALIGWSGLGMEMAVYAIRHPNRVTRLVQVGAVPPAARIMRDAGGDRRAERTDRAAIAALDRRYEAGEFVEDPAGFCRARTRLTRPSSFADTTLAARVPDVCQWENEWPVHLWPYFETLLGSFGDYDWTDEIAGLDLPRLVIHGREDGIPLAGARAWAAGFSNARLLVLSSAGHFPFIERPDAFFPAVDRFLGGEWPPEAEQVERPAS